MRPTTSRSDHRSGTAEEPRLLAVAADDGATQYVYAFWERSPRVELQDKRAVRVFRLVQPDGRTTEVRDEPVRFLMVVPDPQTGESAPVRRRGPRNGSIPPIEKKNVDTWFA